MPDTARGRARYRRILRFAARHLVIIWWYELFLARIGLGAVAERTREARLRRLAQRFRTLAVELGGLMIKLGQFMSTRLDVLPPEITKELEDLQDEVPPAPFDAVRALAEAELGVPLAQVFADITEEPVASASLGQVYSARLAARDAKEAGFERVAVKVQRPGIGDIVSIDLSALRRIARWISRIGVVARRVDLPRLVDEFASTSLEEIDYLHEAANAERFGACFADDDRVRVPDVVWERTTRRVLTLEDVSAIKIRDVDALREAGVSPRKVASVLGDVMLDQLFVHGFFHADPHPGNLFVTPGPRLDGSGGPSWTLTFVDFGMMGAVPPRIRESLRALVIAAAARDGQGMVDAMHKADVLLPSADTAELERAMTKVFARFGGMSIGQLRDIDPNEYRDFALEFSDIMLDMPFQMPENFLLLIRAASLTSGMCTALNPSFNVWDSVEPYANQLMHEESGNLVGDIAAQIGDNARIVWRLPRRADHVLAKIEDGTVGVTMPSLERKIDQVEKIGHRLLSGLIFGALLVSGSRVYSDNELLGVVLMAASVIPLLHVMFGRRHSSRRFR